MQPLTPASTIYPRSLLHGIGPPPKLFYLGRPEVSAGLLISIVGSRKMSAYGKRVINYLLPPIVKAGLTVVSGLAYGVDGYAQRVAIKEGGSCVAVLGSGLDRVYPSSNLDLFNQIIERGGCVFSEFPPGTPPLPAHFPQRNRIVAGLSPLTLIIEAGEHSGTLSTARHALDAGREVAVVPGEITSPQSQGVHRLLKEGAYPVTRPDDLLELYHLPPISASVATPSTADLTAAEINLYDLISCDACTTDQLMERSGLTSEETLQALSALESKGLIESNERIMRWQRT